MSRTPWINGARPERIMLDANIVRGQLTTNIPLWMGEHEVVEPHWSQIVLDEAKNHRPEDMEEAKFDSRIRAMNGFFPEAMIYGHEGLIPQMRAHLKDRHVLAAAVHSRCDTLVTQNTKHFRPPATGPHAVQISRLSGFLMRKLEEQPAAVIAAMEAMVDSHQKEPRTISSLIDVMAHKRMRMLRGFALKLNAAVPPEQRGTSEVLNMTQQARIGLKDIAPVIRPTAPAQTSDQPARPALDSPRRDRATDRAL